MECVARNDAWFVQVTHGSDTIWQVMCGTSPQGGSPHDLVSAKYDKKAHALTVTFPTTSVVDTSASVMDADQSVPANSDGGESTEVTSTGEPKEVGSPSPGPPQGRSDAGFDRSFRLEQLFDAYSFVQLVEEPEPHGRNLFARRAVPVGELVFNASPYAAVISDKHATTACHFCFSRLASPPAMPPCAGCGFARYCSPSCAASDA